MEYWDHTMGPQDRVALRSSAVQAVRNGEKKRHVAQRLGITRQTLHNWVAKHRRGGAAALVAKPRGRVRRQVLEPWQEEQVADTILLLPPSTVSERYTRWTKKAIAEYIEMRFGARLSTWQLDNHLRRWGFESHKQVRRAFMINAAREGASRRSDQTTTEASTRLL
jgi:transposase